jgi:hypothetical protein
MIFYARYPRGSGKRARILATGTKTNLDEELPADPSIADDTHYVEWDDVDPDGRPLNPRFAPRTELTPIVDKTPGRVIVTIPTNEATLTVIVNHTPHVVDTEILPLDPTPLPDPDTGEPAAFDTFTAAVLELVSPIEHTWLIEVDEIHLYINPFQVSN